MTYSKNYYDNYNKNLLPDNISNDVFVFFEKKVKERGILKMIFSHFSSHYNQYIKYIKQLKREDNFVNSVMSMHKILLHQIKYHKNNIPDSERNGLQKLLEELDRYQGRTSDNIFSTTKISEQSNSDCLVFTRFTDILSYFSLKNYNIGDHFVIEYAGNRIKEIIITKENKNNLWTPFKYNLPVFMICGLYYEIRIRSLNRHLNQDIDCYCIYLDTNLRGKCIQNIVQLKHNDNLYIEYENNRVNFLEH